MPRTVHCIKLGKEGAALDRAPYPGALGARVQQQVCKEAWQLWLAHQTRLINEYRLALADVQSRRFLALEMEKFFFGGELAQTNYVPPPASAESVKDS